MVLKVSKLTGKIFIWQVEVPDSWNSKQKNIIDMIF